MRARSSGCALVLPFLFGSAPFGLAVACGGEVTGQADVAEQSEAADVAGDAAVPASEGTAEGPEDDAPPGDITLGECKLGFLRGASETPCNWLAASRCYESKTLACNCVCPREGSSLCLSDFYGGEGSETKATCR